MIVQAEDQGASPNSASVSVEVIVNDINDNSPVFKKNTYTTSIYENATNGKNRWTILFMAFCLRGFAVVVF